MADEHAREAATTKKKAKVTAEHKAESARLLNIWLTRKPEWKDAGRPGTQEELGHLIGITQGACGHFLHGRSTLNLRIALKFAEVLKCDIAEFSERLAKEMALYDDPPPPPGPHVGTIGAGKATPAPESGPLAINAMDALEHLAGVLLSMPERSREPVGQQLALLATVPDSATLVRRIWNMLAPQDAPKVPRSLNAASVAAAKREKSLGALLGRRLDDIPDAKKRQHLFALLEGLIDRVLHESAQGETVSAIAESTRDLQPTPSPSTLP